VALVAILVSGCRSDAASICERLEACHLLQTSGPTATDPNGFTESDCEIQVEDELSESARKSCADCTSAHECAAIVDSCRSVCAPKYCITPDPCDAGEPSDAGM
jgi:hypothetical protein